MLGAVTGLAVVWVLGAVALQVPGQPDLRQAAQRSEVLKRLNEIVSPRTALQVLTRVDPFPALAGPAVLVEAPDPAVLRAPGVREAAPSVVRVLGTACGLGIAGSGWVAKDDTVVTVAHVVAGEDDTTVAAPGGSPLAADVVAFDPKNDIAVLHVSGLGRQPLALVDARRGDRVAILGYPGDGAFTATPGRMGSTLTVAADDAYGHGPVRAHGHGLPRPRPPRQLRRPGRERARRGRGDRLRRTRGQRLGLRRADRDRPQGARERERPCLDRRLRAVSPPPVAGTCPRALNTGARHRPQRRTTL